MTSSITRISLISNIAPIYRESIYRYLNDSFDMKWIFGENKTNIPSCNLSFMTDYHILKTKTGIKNFYWLKGAIKLLFKKNSPENIIMLGEIKFFTSWLVLLKNKINKKKNKKRIILWTHGWYGNETPIQKFIYKIYFGMSDIIMTYGDRSKEIGISTGLNEKKFYVIHNSLNHDKFLDIREAISQFNPSKNQLLEKLFKTVELPLISYIGRLSFHKKIEQVLMAIANLKLEGTNINFMIIGDGPARNSLEKLAEELNLKNNVYFTGAIYNEEESSGFIYLSDAVVSPGHIGLTALHSMELGTPVLTHSDFTSQAPEVEIIKHLKNGYLFKKDSILGISEAIKWAINVQPHRQEIRNICYNSTRSWTPQYQLGIITAILEYLYK